MNDLNLQRIRYEVGQELGHAPDTRAWADRVDREVAQVFTDLWAAEPWPFRLRETALHVYPDFVLAKGTEATLVSGLDVLRVFEIGDVGDLAGRMYPTAEALEDLAVQGHVQRLVGAEWGIDAPATGDRTGGNWGSGPFVVQKATLSGDTVRVWLDPRCRINSYASGGEFAVRFPRYRLPPDFDAFANAAIRREGRPLELISQAQLRILERGVARPPSTAAGRPTCWSYDEGLDHSPDDMIGTALNASRAWSPDATPSAVIETLEGGVNPDTIGSFLPNQLYRFAVSWYYENRFGPLSNIVELTPGTGDTVNLVLPVVEPNAALAPQVHLGWTIAIWIAKADGPFELSQFVDPPPNGGGVSNVVVVTGRPDPLTQYRRVRYEQVATPPRYIRLWPRPATYEQLLLRYHRRPTPMEADTDVPDGILPQFRKYLVYETAARLAAEPAPGGAPALSTVGRLRAQAAQVYRRMLGHYFPGRERGHQRRALLAPTRIDLLRPSAEDIDWNGDS